MGLLDLSGRSALVVGAGMGIGRATARMLGAAGAHTVVLDRHGDRAEEVANVIREARGRAEVIVADVTASSDVVEVVDEADRLSGGIDILVNITGSATWIPLLELDDATWDRDFAITLEQHRYVSRAVTRRWVDRGRPGVVCVVASISGLFGSSMHGAYGAAKAGLTSFVRSAAEEWWPLGIRVNAVVPGSVRTPRIEATLMKNESLAPLPEGIARMAMPEDIAGPIAYLVSDLSKKVTGQTIIVDGGTTTRFPYALT
ncbi:MAG: SDR family oxidoreductase [bacterium]|nr:hypothetical protein [Deltaproteobacteria bacterium]MCP4906118.1 SDR family oxidoreductase [bacterium]